MKHRKVHAMWAWCIIALLSTTSGVNAQSKVVSLNLKNEPLKSLLGAIEKQTDYLFLFDAGLIEQVKSISVTADNVSTKEVLSKQLTPHGLSFSLEGKHIIIKKTEQAAATKTTASKVKLTGTVRDHLGEAVIGCNIVAGDGAIGTITDFDGHYTIEVPQNSEVQFSYIGYETYSHIASNSGEKNVMLREDGKALEELVVVGYGTQRKALVTHAIASFKPTDENMRQVLSPSELLQGRVAGVSVSTGSGNLGSSERMSIRGSSSISASNEPLYVIDGVPIVNDNASLFNMGENMSSLASLNLTDIESMEVLKDAASAAIYGSRGTNGVIVITTKSGREGKSSLKVNLSTSASTWANKDRIKFADSDLYIAQYNEAVRNYNTQYKLAVGDKNYKLPISNPFQGLSDTDWLDQITQTGIGYNADVSFSGGNEKTKFYVSGNINHQTGIIQTNEITINYNDLMAKTVKLQATQGEINDVVTSISGETGVSYEFIATPGANKTTVPASSDTNPDTKPDANTDVIPKPPTTVNQVAIDRLDTALDYMYKTVPAPALGTNFGEWSVLSLGRGEYDVSDTYYSDYVARLAQTMIDKKGVLHRIKKTENSRVILALSSLGIEPFDIGGYDVTADLADFSDVCKQGINGPVFALIAMDTNNYKFPANDDAADQNTRTKMLEYLFTKEISGGGFALTGTTPDPDMTAMTLEALTTYVNGNDLLKEEFGSDEAGYNAIITKVNEVVDRGLTTLSNLQQEDGDFASWGTINAESTAQTIVALVGLGIDPMTDVRFITDTNKTLLDGLLKYSADEGGFKHTVDGSVDAMATDQATYALVAYKRYVNGQNRLYDMSDAFEDGSITNPDQNLDQQVKDKVIITTPDQILGEAGTEFNAVVTANAWTDSTVKLIDGVYNIPEGLEVVDITMGSSVTGGEIDYNLEEGKLRFAYMSKTLANIELTTETFPVELMTIKLKLVDKVTEEKDLEIAAEAMSFKTDSETSEELSVANAKDSVTVLVPIPDPVANARILYTGDDSDLIDSTTQAVAVEILNLEETSKVMFGDIEMLYSAEMTAKKGVDTYVVITSTDVNVEALNDVANYTITAETPASITFADVNEDKVVNAQDALDTLAFWLRKEEIQEDKEILAANVNASSAITTSDVLAIMEHVVNARELDIVTK